MRKTDVTVKWPAEVQEGKLYIHARQEFDTYLVTNFEGKKVSVNVEEVKRPRSLRQNNYYWGVIIPISSDEMGCTPLEAHHIFGEEFLQYEKIMKNGLRRSLIRSTSDLSTAEAEDYYRQCRQFMASEYNAYIPLPNEVEWTGRTQDPRERN